MGMLAGMTDWDEKAQHVLVLVLAVWNDETGVEETSQSSCWDDEHWEVGLFGNKRRPPPQQQLKKNEDEMITMALADLHLTQELLSVSSVVCRMGS
jgi:hypothetical protein